MTVRGIMGGMAALLVGFGSVSAYAASNPGGPCYEEKQDDDITGYYRIAIGNVGRLVSPAETGRGDPSATAYVVSGVYNKVFVTGAAPRAVSGSIQAQANSGALMGLFVYQAAVDKPISMNCTASRSSITPGTWSCLVAFADGSSAGLTLTKVDPVLHPLCQADLGP